jgi:hypothetical protein
MPEGRVSPLFPPKLMLAPFVFILMIEIGSSPERIKDDKNSSQNSEKRKMLKWFTMV